MNTNQALTEVRGLIANDAYAVSFQSLAQYRAALVAIIDRLTEGTQEAVSSPPATQAGQWIEWDGKGPRPVKPESAVEIQCRSGQRFAGKAGGYSWSHIDVPSDIIAYRIIKE